MGQWRGSRVRSGTPPITERDAQSGEAQEVAWEVIPADFAVLDTLTSPLPFPLRLVREIG